MARKDTLRSEIATAQSLAANFISAPTSVKFLDNFSYQINILTSNSTGTFSVQASDDYSPGGPIEGVANAGTWVDLVLGGGVPTVAAANDSILINLNQLPFTAVRLKYTSTVAGTGTCDIWVVAKQLGA